VEWWRGECVVSCQIMGRSTNLSWADLHSENKDLEEKKKEEQVEFLNLLISSEIIILNKTLAKKKLL
jgi:hypothetical protein